MEFKRREIFTSNREEEKTDERITDGVKQDISLPGNLHLSPQIVVYRRSAMIERPNMIACTASKHGVAHQSHWA